MPNGTGERVTWNEDAALEELERLRRSIEEWRQRRKDVQAEFEGFVRGFRNPSREAVVERPPLIAPPAIALPPTIVSPPATAAPPPATSSSVGDPAADDSGAPIAPVSVESIETPTTAPAAAPMLRSPDERLRRGRMISVGGGLLALGAIGVLIAWLMQGPDRPATRASNTPRPNAPAVSGSAPAPAAAQPAAPAASPRSEIIAVKRVWVRVTAAGVRVAERELQAGERVSLGAAGTAIIRAGNAGAVRLTINGEDRGLLGPEGEVVTRTLQLPAPADR